jgi:hypothetical protein
MVSRFESVRSILKGLICLALLALLGCNGFGSGNSTLPGSTPNLAAQVVFRMVGNLGTPFLATVADQRSSWQIHGVVPLNIIIANGNNPDRIVATKLTNDTELLSVEVISGFAIATVSSTIANYGVVVAGINGKLKALPPPASPDVRFFVNGPARGIFNAIVEDQTTAFVLQSSAPCVILYDHPNNNSVTGRVDGIFNVVGGAGGPLSIDLRFDNGFAHASGGGTQTVKIH